MISTPIVIALAAWAGFVVLAVLFIAAAGQLDEEIEDRLNAGSPGQPD